MDPQPIERDSFSDPAPPSTEGPTPRRTFAGIAWVVILALCTLAAVGQAVRQESQTGEDTIGLMLMRLQSQYFVYAARLQGAGGGLLYQQAEAALNIGTVPQRQRFVPVAAELQSPEEAIAVLDELERLIAENPADRGEDGAPAELSPEQLRINGLLRAIYAARIAGQPDPLDDEDRAFLTEQMGWFGRLALNPPDAGDASARQAVLAPGQGLLVLFMSALGVLAFGGLAGFVGLLILLVLALVRRLPGGLCPSPVAHGVYAETFAIWMVLFIGLQVLSAVVAGLLGIGPMVPGLAAFFLSLLSLAWPVIRGVPWAQVRRDVGLTLGRQPALEPVIGVGGYLMGLPILALGILGTLLLLLIQGLIAGPAPTFGPSGGPAHPVIEQLGGADWWPKIQVLALASIAAPIVEETMFRGVLYRHLRMATGRMPTVLSVIVSGLIGAFLFAIIHPQGWVAVPALMSLAVAFTLAREWRGTLLVPMIMHGVSNGLVLSLLMAALTISRRG
ncbi:MAG: lysostaphin resistance A-like protein [Planctomycetota bacterium]|jgi:membrane protease YdiL (CAAX protease family)